jgi:hypothetical protein
MGIKNITQTQKSTANSVQCESDADCVFCFEGIIHHEFLPLGQTVNMEYYSEDDEKAERGSEQKRSGSWRGK